MRTPRSSAAIPSPRCGAISTGTSRSWPAGPRSGSDVAPRHVVLVGLPGSGKTTVGTLAARELGAPFTDLDVVIASRAGKSVGAITLLPARDANRKSTRLNSSHQII